MDENNTPVKKPNKKSLGMLVMILSLVLVAIILVIVIVVSTGNSADESSSDSGSTLAPADSGTPGSSSGNDPESTPAPDTSSAPDSSSSQPPVTVDPVKPTLTETVATAGDSGKITLNTADIGAGLLVLIDGDHTYKLPLDQRFIGGKDVTPADAEKAGFYKLNQNALNKTFPVRNLDAFMRQEALRAFAAMVQTFESVSHTERTFLVRSYSSTVRENNTSNFVTGNAVGLYIIEGENQLGFNYGAKKVTVDGKSMTYEAWFKENCAKYGFYYEGLIGDKNFAEGKFLYVGSIHAAGVEKAGGLAKYQEGIRNGSITTATAADGSQWKLIYTPVGSEATVEVEVGAGARYVVSGDNVGGFITAYQTPAAQ